MKVTWKKDDTKYSNGELGRVGKWLVFTCCYDGCVSRGEKNKYRLNCHLPGIKDNLGLFPGPEEAKAKADKVLAYWLAEAEKTSEGDKHEG